jgi:hypothetical protein
VKQPIRTNGGSHFNQARRPVSSRAPTPSQTSMDDLAVAASVLAMDIDENDLDMMEQEPEPGAHDDNLQAAQASEPSPVDKEDKRDPPERRGGRAADEKVATVN